MISREKARELALAKIRSKWSVRDDEPSIADDATREEKFTWIFFYNSKRFHQTKELSFRLAGNGPVVVDRESGEVVLLGTAGGIEHQIAQYYRQKREPNQALEPTATAVTDRAAHAPRQP
jgi:hypothetical protein